MYDYVISQVKLLTSHGLIHPTPVQNALDLLAALDTVELSEPKALLNTRPQVHNSVEALAKHLSVVDKLSAAKLQLKPALEAKVLDAVRECADGYLEQLLPVFDEAREEYVESVQMLPMEFDADQVLRFNPETMAAYAMAKQAADQLLAVRNALAALSQIIPGKQLGQHVANDMLIMAPEDVAQFVFTQVENGLGGSSRDSAYLAIAPKLRKALVNGISLEPRLGDDANAAYVELENKRQLMPQLDYQRACQALVK
ncbi:hypothetical protein WG915_04890 [Corynebacterium sp. H128]|uniref:hypothetical protein n=1 Tax=Corynebacterium sp. H128 TaxID=3133427 RepID=UPI0030AB3C07